MTTLTGGNPTPGLPDVPDDLMAAFSRRFANDTTGDDPATDDDPVTTAATPDAPGSSPESGDRAEGADQGDAETGLPPVSASPDPADPASGDPATSDPADPAADPPPATPTTYNVTVQGQQLQLTQQQIETMISLANWADSLDPKVAAQMSALASGQAIALSRDEYLQLQRGATPPGPPSATAPATIAKPDLTYTDDEVRRYVEQLERAATAATTATADPTPYDPTANPQYVAAMQRMYEQELAAKATEYDQAVAQYRTQRPGLTDEDFTRLETVATQTEAFRRFHSEGLRYAPDGSLIHEPPVSVTATQALDFVLARDPALYMKAMTPTNTGVPSTATAAVTDTAVARKKANAASLAAAPAAAISPPATDPRAMSHDDRVSGMAAMIRQLEGLQ